MTVARWQVFLPGPLPGLNQLVAAAKQRGRNGWNGYAALKRRWESAIHLAVTRARAPRFCRAWLGFQWIEPSRRRDPDNLAAGGRKLVLDALVRAGVLDGDGWQTVAGWADRFAVDPKKPGLQLSMVGIVRMLALCVVIGLMGAAASVWASPVNLAPDWPLRLDDAYPVAPGEWQLQSAVRQEWTSAANRFTLRTDLRIGVRDRWEFAIGMTPAQDGALGGDPTDHRAVRIGFLAPVTRQDGAWPTQAVRLTVSPPIAGGSRSPSLRADWLDSWRMDHRTWLHFNASYLVAPDPVPGGLTPGRRDWWQFRTGVVRALTVDGLALAASVGLMPSPFAVGDQLRWDPELAAIVPLAKGFVFSVGGGVLVQSDSAMRVQAGLSWNF